MKINVLDHGYVELIQHVGTDETVIRAARMSTNKGFQDWEKDAKLLEYLYKNDHHTPFEMCDLTVEIQAPIFVFREWHRHRTQSYNEMSARYTQMPDIHYIPAPERIQSQDTKNKQGSSGELRSGVVAGFLANTQQDQANVYRNYETALGDGVAREIARINTPVSRYSKMWAKANLRNWLHFLDLRERPNAQEEIRVFADAVAQIVMDLYPRTYALFEEHTLYAKKLSRTDVQKLREILGMLHPADTEAAAILAKLT